MGRTAIGYDRPGLMSIEARRGGEEDASGGRWAEPPGAPEFGRDFQAGGQVPGVSKFPAERPVWGWLGSRKVGRDESEEAMRLGEAWGGPCAVL